MPAVRFETDGHVAIITINRPDARNAVNNDVAMGMEDAIDQLESDDALWIGIITGEGSSFCAGADLKEINAGRGNTLATKRGGFGGMVTRQRRKPLIAAVNGPAVAGGCEIMLACDMAVVAEGVPIGVPEVKRSLIAAAGALHRLPRAMGPARAMEMVLTGDPITPEDALSAGLINAVVPLDQLMDAARALAARVAANAPLAVQASRSVAILAFDADQDELFREAGRAFLGLVKTEDFKEGPRAFIEKRAPQWKGR